ncbi:hypothetical protein IE81DRAFT_322473 [Ceraceosorus guamensis]|uniref:Uncharacterized protein n=1 Tax=Ceraceosorus guamensis TaxID=1522189 RepID=A0A316W5V3_9BASI|nr:hypothetical protein IE81DRAFT_322473 [Ceraceosorus guamensis]PWN43403.1 hypothetical protein IE81DRAFT_322473 [Ceraceosorus guamensis]
MPESSSKGRMSAFGVVPQAVVVPAADGFPLAAHRFEPPPGSSAVGQTDGQEVRAVVVVVNATGVQARFYHDFACWLAMQGLCAFTFDFRYSGNSFPKQWLDKLEGAGDEEEYAQVFEQAIRTAPDEIGLIRTWGREDLAAVARFAHDAHPRAPMCFFGNSLGGHLMTVLEPRMLQSFGVPIRFADVNGGNAHWRNHTEPEESLFGFNEVIIKPIETDRLFRSSSLGLGYDIPYGPGKDWIDWFTHPLFSLHVPEDEQRAKENVRMFDWIYFSFSDDETISRHMMHQHASLLCGKGSRTKTLFIDPPKLKGWPKCGHVTCFRPSGPRLPNKTGSPRNVITGKADNSGEGSSSDIGEGSVVEEDDDDDDGAERAVRGGEAYEPKELPEEIARGEGADADAASEPTELLGREDSIWQVFLKYALEGLDTVDPALGDLRTWDETNARDCDALRREERLVRAKAAAEGAKGKTDSKARL